MRVLRAKDGPTRLAVTPFEVSRSPMVQKPLRHLISVLVCVAMARCFSTRVLGMRHRGNRAIPYPAPASYVVSWAKTPTCERKVPMQPWTISSSGLLT